MTYRYGFHDKLKPKLRKHAKRNPKDYRNVRNKISQILENPEHYKPLSGQMKGQRRVHVNTHFVLTYEIQDDLVVFLDYDHHDNVYLPR